MCGGGGGDFVVFLNVITNICVFDLFILVFVLTSSMLEAVKNCLIRRPKVRIAFGLKVV